MTMEEVTKAMLVNFGEEIGDANKYCDMAHAAEEHGWECTAEGLYEMARDEYTHAYFIKKTLHENNIAIPDDHMKKFHELEERMERTFS